MRCPLPAWPDRPPLSSTPYPVTPFSYILPGSFLAGHGGLRLPAANLRQCIKMVTIRLQRRGGKKEPFYHVVVIDSRRAGGGSLEQLGFFNPVARGNSVELRLDLARIDYWLGVGAQPSDRVAQLVKSYRKSQVAAAA